MKNSSSHFPLHPNTPQQPIPHTQQNELHPPPSDDDIDHHREKPRSEWDFSLSTVISSSSTAANAASDAIGAIEFDHTNSFFATGGIARKIRVYTAGKLIPPRANDGNDPATTFLDHTAACEFYLCTPARLSSLKWKPGSGSRVIGSGDYDGVVTEYDLEKRVPTFERDEHGGKRVWSVDYSDLARPLGASGSDDGTMQMWDTRCEAGTRVARVNPARNPICSVEFNPFGGHLIAAGCADRKIYGYDVRKMVEPVFVLDRHGKAVTYTSFLDPQTIVSSSIDGCLIMWDVENQNPVRTYKGHVNNRRFVGLSVWRTGGLLSCGSENNSVFVYDKRWADPIWVRGFEPAARHDGSFVSGVCWRQTVEERCTLVAGGSDGVLQVFEGERKLCLLN
ncbi:WD repeat-containing protein rup2 [Phtheirospermum japonicum]|uniref:WD repeat-containing protein rup2 n=1 Tax=Phtheirospermum japonicum TaxID=374723 RepID=A0A830BKX1_9LAMI|nr:WD repeat-containing protein rup2 [Phtheirospermum japonicum]